MDYAFMHPLYENGEEEVAVDHIAEYLENNNRPEFDVTNINHEEFIKAPLLVPREQTEAILKTQYGKNIILVGNVLRMQDLFFKDYMPHICKYLDILGIKCFCSLFRPSQFTGLHIIKMYTSGKKTVPLRYWNPNVEWADLSYTKNVDDNLTNPINNFYSASLDIYGINNDDFIEAIGRIYGMNLKRKDKSRPSNMSLKILPCANPLTMIQVTEAIHKYL